MNRIRLLAALTIFLVGLAAFAQQDVGASGNTEKAHQGQRTGTLGAEDHLKMLSEKLDLSADQQDKLRPILQNMLDERQKVMDDQSLTSEERAEKQRALHEKADHEARKFLSDEQKKKLDDLEAQHHAESAAHPQH